MIWTVLCFAFLGLWAMLSVLSGEHRRQTEEQKARELLEAEAAKNNKPQA